MARPSGAVGDDADEAGAVEVTGLRPSTEAPIAARLDGRAKRAGAGQNKRWAENFESSQPPSHRARPAAGASGSGGGAAVDPVAGGDGAADTAAQQAAAEQERAAAEQAAVTEQQRVIEAAGQYCLRSEQHVLARYPDLVVRLATCSDLAVLRLLCSMLYGDLEQAEVRVNAAETGLAQLAEMGASTLTAAETCANQQQQLAQNVQRLVTRVEQVRSGVALLTDLEAEEPAGGGGMTIEVLRLSGLGLLGRTNQVFVLRLTREGDDNMQSEPYVIEREVVSVYGPPPNAAPEDIASLQQKASH